MKKLFLVLFALLPLIGCKDDIFSDSSDDISGTWRLYYNSGILHDVCPGEVVTFPSNTGGIAVLKCPNEDSLSRHYTVSGSTLTYTETGVSYTITGLSSTDLQLEGTGSSQGRYLYYSKVTAMLR